MEFWDEGDEVIINPQFFEAGHFDAVKTLNGYDLTFPNMELSEVWKRNLPDGKEHIITDLNDYMNDNLQNYSFCTLHVFSLAVI